MFKLFTIFALFCNPVYAQPLSAIPWFIEDSGKGDLPAYPEPIKVWEGDEEELWDNCEYNFEEYRDYCTVDFPPINQAAGYAFLSLAAVLGYNVTARWIGTDELHGWSANAVVDTENWNGYGCDKISIGFQDNNGQGVSRKYSACMLNGGVIELNTEYAMTVTPVTNIDNCEVIRIDAEVENTYFGVYGKVCHGQDEIIVYQMPLDF